MTDENSVIFEDLTMGFEDLDIGDYFVREPNGTKLFQKISEELAQGPAKTEPVPFNPEDRVRRIPFTLEG